jgi:hydrogenase-4 component F
LLLLAIVFIGMASALLEVVLGDPPEGAVRARESAWLIAGPLVLASMVLLLGVHIPAPLARMLERAAGALGGFAP